MIGQLIGVDRWLVVETVVVWISVRLQLGVQRVLEIDGGYNAALGAGARTNGLSIQGYIEHGR